MPDNHLRDLAFFLCIDLDDRTREALVRLASEIRPEWLPPDRLSTTVDVVFDEEKERVVAWKRTRYDDLVLTENEAPARGEAAEQILAEAAADRLDRALALDDPEVAGFLAPPALAPRVDARAGPPCLRRRPAPGAAAGPRRRPQILRRVATSTAPAYPSRSAHP